MQINVCSFLFLTELTVLASESDSAESSAARHRKNRIVCTKIGRQYRAYPHGVSRQQLSKKSGQKFISDDTPFRKSNRAAFADYIFRSAAAFIIFVYFAEIIIILLLCLIYRLDYTTFCLICQ